MDVSLTKHILFFLVVFLGSFSQAITGIGFGVVVMSLLPFFLPYVDSLIGIRIASLCFLFAFLFDGKLKNVRWKELAVPFITSIGGTYLATLLLYDPNNERAVKIILGVFIALMGLFSVLYKKEVHFKANLISGSIVGIVMGFFSGACGVAGPPLAMYFLNIDSLRNDKDCYYATTIMTFQIIGIEQLLIFMSGGKISHMALTIAAEGVVPTIVGIILGQLIYKKIDIKLVKQLIYAFMIVMGIICILSQIR